jgi:hypothetical protein
MGDPREQQRELDEIELEPETIKDLDVDDEEPGQIRGGCSTSGTLSLNK